MKRGTISTLLILVPRMRSRSKPARTMIYLGTSMSSKGAYVRTTKGMIRVPGANHE